MRKLALLFLLTLLATFCLGQNYSPKAGETVLRIAVEGRGNVFVKLYVREAPKTCAQILQLVRRGFYNGQRFHKVIKSPRPYLVQIGDPASKGAEFDQSGGGGSGSRVPYEDSGFKNEAGAVGLATVEGDPSSGDSQFYMLLDRASFLDKKYTVFGQVVEGMDVLKRIERGDKVTAITVLGN